MAWAYDFVSDTTPAEQKIESFSVVVGYTRECLAIGLTSIFGRRSRLKRKKPVA